jgi:hypothetical protein
MDQQIRGHERSIAVASNADSVGIRNAHLDSFVDRCFRSGNDLLNISVVHLFHGSDDGQ